LDATPADRPEEQAEKIERDRGRKWSREALNVTANAARTAAHVRTLRRKSNPKKLLSSVSKARASLSNGLTAEAASSLIWLLSSCPRN
jgi:hypothetical protein